MAKYRVLLTEQWHIPRDITVEAENEMDAVANAKEVSANKRLNVLDFYFSGYDVDGVENVEEEA